MDALSFWLDRFRCFIFNTNEQTYSRPRLQESTYVLSQPWIDKLTMRLTRTSVTPLRKQSPQGDDLSLAATALLVKLDRTRRDRWSEAIWSINFSHSSRKAWSILNNFTGRSRHSPRRCPILPNAIASQLVRNGKYKAADCKSSRLVSKSV